MIVKKVINGKVIELHPVSKLSAPFLVFEANDTNEVITKKEASSTKENILNKMALFGGDSV